MKQKFYKLVKNNGLMIVLSVFVLIILGKYFQKKVDALFDFTIISSIIVVALLNFGTAILSNIILNHLEDDMKLESCSDRLCERYMDKMIQYDNSHADSYNMDKMIGKSKSQDHIYNFPIICDFWLNGVEIVIEDNNEMYELPSMIEKNYDEIMRAHSMSKVYNRLMIRVDDWKLNNHVFRIWTSRTTYYKSLATNRAMDYKWSNGMTNREMYLFGPDLTNLNKSVFSNHLGFNGFIESEDGYIPFVRRKRDVSIAKGEYGNSIGAVVEIKYLLRGDNDSLNVEGIYEAIENTINKELGISDEKVHSNNIIAAYRSIVEGGKPQLLIYMKTDKSRDEINKSFGKKENREGRDGKKILWIHRDELSGLYITSDRIIYRGKCYKMGALGTASIVMLLHYLQGGEDYEI